MNPKVSDRKRLTDEEHHEKGDDEYEASPDSDPDGPMGEINVSRAYFQADDGCREKQLSNTQNSGDPSRKAFGETHCYSDRLFGWLCVIALMVERQVISVK